LFSPVRSTYIENKMQQYLDFLPEGQITIYRSTSGPTGNNGIQRSNFLLVSERSAVFHALCFFVFMAMG
ncbi:MAG TPA: hypothetical protein VN631_13980, partial [Negativicutes bacterium]|nr:hypothetical protein [Negativicutes bacterium]